MRTSLPDSHPAHKDAFAPEMVPPRIPLPGPELAEYISRSLGDGRPHWRVAAPMSRLLNGEPVWGVSCLILPRLTGVAVHDPASGKPVLFGGLVAHQRNQREYREQRGVCKRVLDWLDTPGEDAWSQLGPHGHSQLKRMAAAVLRDIWGYSEEAIAGTLGYSDARAARRLVSDGRPWLPFLCAWPWCEWQNGKPPDGWWQHGADPELAAALQTWVTGKPVLAAA